MRACSRWPGRQARHLRGNRHRKFQGGPLPIPVSSDPCPSNKIRLFAIGPAAKTTGYSRVLACILSGIAESFDTVHFAINYYGPEISHPYRILPNLLLGDYFGKKQLPVLLEQYRPNIVFLYHDIEFYQVHREILDRYKEQTYNAAVVIYCPVEWEETLPGNLTPLAGADRTVFFTEFGRNVFRRAVQLSGATCQTPPAVIPHGVDTSQFSPLLPGDRQASRRMARSILFRDRPELAHAFLLLNANRNSPRKRIGLTLEIFAEFARDKPDAYLYLHMGMRDCGCDLLTIAQDLNIESRLLLTTRNAEKPNISDEHLNRIYNACDVGINTSSGEGWGLVAMEHAATGAPQILPAHSACREVWANDGILIPEIQSKDHLLDTAHAVGQLNLLYSQPGYLLRASERSLHLARDPKFSWNRIARQWMDLFAESIRTA